MKRLMCLLFALVLFVISAPGWANPHIVPPHHGPDYILHNGRIFTSDTGDLWAQAVAVKDRRILAVGTDQEVLHLARHGTEIIDLNGRLVIPGLNDAHVHSAPINSNGPIINPPDFIPGPGPTLAEMLGYLWYGASQAPPGVWLYGIIGDALLDDLTVNRFVLDSVTPNNPVLLVGWSGHGVFINTAAMVDLGLAENAPDPYAGRYGRVPGTDILDGSVWEYAEYQIWRQLLDRMPIEAARTAFHAFAEASVQYGVTSLQDMSPYSADRLQAIMTGLELPLRIRNICFKVGRNDACAPVSANKPDSKITWSGVKWVLDGTPIERGAALRQPYNDRPAQSGTLNIPASDIRAQLRERLHGFPVFQQPLYHATGDRSAKALLDALKSTAPNWLWRFLRPRLEHGDMLMPDLIADARDLGVVVVQNPTHFTSVAAFYARLGPARVAQMQPLRSLVEQGIVVALGSDAIGQPLSPFVDLMLAVVHPTRPSEGLTLEQAVIAHTAGSAYAEFEEFRKGKLAPGMLADLAVLSQDIFLVPIQALPATYSVLTMVDGQIVFATGEL